MTAAADLLAELRGLGIELQPHGESLRFRPRDRMTPDLLARTRMHKAELLAMFHPEDVQAAFVEAPVRTPDDWPAALADFVLLLTPDDLPAEPFELNPWTTVVDRTRFLKWLQADIRRGETGPRARLGALQTDLRHLWQRLRDLAQDGRERIKTACESSK